VAQPHVLLLHIAPDETAMLTRPVGWWAGDAAAVLAGARPPGLVEALLGAGAAVIECDATPPPAAVAALARLLEAARGLLGARLVVALGAGEWTNSVLDARSLGVATAVVLGPDPLVLPGSEPEPEQRWEFWAPLLCAALAAADPLLGEACERGLTRPSSHHAAAGQAGSTRLSGVSKSRSTASPAPSMQ